MSEKFQPEVEPIIERIDVEIDGLNQPAKGVNYIPPGSSLFGVAVFGLSHVEEEKAFPDLPKKTPETSLLADTDDQT